MAGPAAWNSLPDYLRDPSLSEDTFRRLLKTYSARSALEALHNALYKLLLTYLRKAKFHYVILFADRSEAGRRRVADLLARARLLLVIGQIPARCMSATSLGPVCDQDSVMEFGFYLLTY